MVRLADVDGLGTVIILSKVTARNPVLELQTGFKCYNTSGGDWDFFTGLGIASGTCVLRAQTEISEAG